MKEEEVAIYWADLRSSDKTDEAGGTFGKPGALFGYRRPTPRVVISSADPVFVFEISDRMWSVDGKPALFRIHAPTEEAARAKLAETYQFDEIEGVERPTFRRVSGLISPDGGFFAVRR